MDEQATRCEAINCRYLKLTDFPFTVEPIHETSRRRVKYQIPSLVGFSHKVQKRPGVDSNITICLGERLLCDVSFSYLFCIQL